MKKIFKFILPIYSIITLIITLYNFINPVLTNYYWCEECTGKYYDYTNFFISAIVFVVGFILIYTIKKYNEIKEGFVNLQDLKLMRNIYISISLFISGLLYVHTGNSLGVQNYFEYSILISISIGIILHSLLKFKIETYKKPNG